MASYARSFVCVNHHLDPAAAVLRFLTMQRMRARVCTSVSHGRHLERACFCKELRARVTKSSNATCSSGSMQPLHALGTLSAVAASRILMALCACGGRARSLMVTAAMFVRFLFGKERNHRVTMLVRLLATAIPSSSRTSHRCILTGSTRRAEHVRGTQTHPAQHARATYTRSHARAYTLRHKHYTSTLPL